VGRLLHGLDPGEMRLRAETARIERFRSLEKTGREKTVRIAKSIPTRYRDRYVKVHLGEASPRTIMRAHCEQCVGWEEAPVSIGTCKSFSCALWRTRPYQAKAGDPG